MILLLHMSTVNPAHLDHFFVIPLIFKTQYINQLDPITNVNLYCYLLYLKFKFYYTYAFLLYRIYIVFIFLVLYTSIYINKHIREYEIYA